MRVELISARFLLFFGTIPAVLPKHPAVPDNGPRLSAERREISPAGSDNG